MGRDDHRIGPPRLRGGAERDDGGRQVAIYHVVSRHEGFEDAASKLLELVRQCERSYPGKPRALFLDIEGHRAPAGGYDDGMVELQQAYVLGFLMPFLSEAQIPLIGGRVVNPNDQRSDVPGELTIQDAAI